MSNHHPGTGAGRRLHSAILAGTAVVLTGVVWAVGWLPPMERATGDLLLRTTEADAISEQPVVAILIDDKAVDVVGPLPWPRKRIADLVTSLQANGVTGVAIDLMLSASSRMEDDLELETALAGGPIVLAAAFDRDGFWLLPAETFGGASRAAHAYGEVGPDGVVRTISSTKQRHGLALPALSLAAARMLRPELAIEAGVELRPEFRPAPQDVSSLSAVSVLDRSVRAEEIEDKVAFIGVSATGAGDQFVVPTGPRHQPVPGVLAHASATASIVRGRLLRVPGWGWSLVAALLLSLGIQWIRDQRGAFDLVSFAAILFGTIGLAMLAVRFSLLLIPATSLLTVAIVSALLREAVESWAARRESGIVLSALLDHVGEKTSTVPTTAAGRLDALRRLQEGVLDEDATRRALLADMAEGVILWDRDGNRLLANPSAERLWGGLPDFQEVIRDRASDEPVTITRGARELAVGITDVGRGHLAIMRDITAEVALERRRREMQRLVSHELKTPLSSIAGFGESLERYELDGDEQRRVASLIRGEAHRLQQMVTVFLDLERLGGGRWDGAQEAIDLGHLVRSRIEVLAAAAHTKQIVISTKIADDCTTHVVPTLLERVVDNLVGNAIKYTGAGDEIEVSVRRSGNEIHLQVRDHGPGIPDEAQAKVFDRFYRVPGTQDGGAGLGLALVKEVVDWHGGCIYLTSEIDAGSEFTVILPAAGEV